MNLYINKDVRIVLGFLNQRPPWLTADANSVILFYKKFKKELQGLRLVGLQEVKKEKGAKEVFTLYLS